MSLPRRQKALVGLLVLLLLAAVGYRGYRWWSARKSQAHWQEMIDRQAEFARVNGLPNPAGEQSPVAPPVATTDAKTIAGPAASIEPVYLLWKASDWEGRLLSNIDGCLPIDSGRDLVWAGSDMFVLNEPGRIDRVWTEDPRRLAFFEATRFSRSVSRPIFDGRYVWLSIGERGGSRVVVVDPATHRDWEFGSQATGLFPENVQQLQINLAPVRPGVVCAFIVANDTWLAMLHFDPDGKHEVEVVELPKGVTLGRNADLLFALEATVDGKRMQRIVVGRENLPPLLLDPETNQATTATANSSPFARLFGHFCIDRGSFWWQNKSANSDTETTLMRATLPDLKEQAVLAKVPSGLMAPLDGGLALVGRDCWQWKGKGAEIGRLDADVFWNFVDTLEAPVQGIVTPPPQARQDASPTIDDLFSASPEKPPPNVLAFMEPPHLFPSNVYGLLLSINRRTGGHRQVHRIAIADAAGEGAGTKVTPGAHQLRARALTTSRFVLAPPADDAPDRTSAAMLDAPVEPVTLHWRQRLPLLARELVRQSLWLAARSELGGAVADSALGESVPEMDGTREFRLSSSFGMDGSAEVSLESVGAEGSPANWRQELRLANRDGMLDYPLLVETAEAWSRTDFLSRLSLRERPSLRGAKAGDAGEPSAEVEAALDEMTFPAQFAAVQACSRGKAGDLSEKALGALVRGYANLGLLTEHHWNIVHKTFQARALLYAQRMVVNEPDSPAGLWHRAYAEALAGLPGAALTDLAKAQKLAADEPPAWVPVIAALCHSDQEALAAHDDDPQVGQLAALLRFVQLSWLPPSVVATQAAAHVIERQPECFRAYIAIYDCCELDGLRKSIPAASKALEDRLPARVRQMPGLPASVVEQLDAANEKSPAIERLTGALLDATENDASDLSWQALGSLVSETVFAQTWRQVHFLRFQVDEDAEEFLAKAVPRVARHRCRRLLDFYAEDVQHSVNEYFVPVAKLDDRRKAAAAELLKRVDLASLTELQQRLYDYFFGQPWQVQQPEQYAAARSRSVEHRDSVMGDLLRYVDGGRSLAMLPNFGIARGEIDRDTLRQLNALNPGNPDAVAAALDHDQWRAAKLSQAVLGKYPKHPHVLQALSARLDASSAQGQQVLSQYIKLSPDSWAYESLARVYLNAKRIDEWQALLDDYLSRQPNSEQAAETRVGMANVFLSRGEFEKALPYAEAAAAKNGEAAIGCLIRCYQGLGEDEEEGVWHEKMVDRHPSGPNARERYLWSRRSGLGDAKVLADDASMRLGGGNAFPGRFFQGRRGQGFSQGRNELAYSEARNGAFFWLVGRTDEAVAFYQAAAEQSQDQGLAGFCHSCCALIAEEKGDQAARDTELAGVAVLRGPQTDHYRQLANLLSKGFSEKETKIDPEEAAELAASAPANDRGAMNFLLGYAMLLLGQTREAVPLLSTAATFRQGAGSMSRTLAAAALRDRGVVPGKLNRSPE